MKSVLPKYRMREMNKMYCKKTRACFPEALVSWRFKVNISLVYYSIIKDDLNQI